MKKLLCTILVLVMSVMCMFAVVGCEFGDEPNSSASGSTSNSTSTSTISDADLAKDAMRSIRGLYLDKAKETPNDYTVIGEVPTKNGKYAVTWTVEKAEGSTIENLAEYVSVGEMDASTKLVTVTVKKGAQEVPYILKATITVGSATETLELTKKVPATLVGMTVAEAKALGATLASDAYYQEDGANKKIAVQGYVTDAGTYSSQYNNYSKVYISDTKGGTDTLYVYRIASDEKFITGEGSLKVDDFVVLEGYLQNYKGNTLELTYFEKENVQVVDLQREIDTRTDAEKLSDELEALSFDKTSYSFVGAYALPTPSIDSGVEFAWVSDTESLVKIENGKLNVLSIPDTETTVKLHLTATCGNETQEKEITLTLKQPAAGEAQHAGTLEDPYSVADAIAIAKTVANNGSYYEENGSKKLVHVKGYVVDAGTYNVQYSNYNNVKIADTEGGTTTFLIYRIKQDEKFLTGPDMLAVGDLVTFQGYIQNYNDKYELTYFDTVSVYVVAMTKGSGENPDPNPPTPVGTEHAGTQADPYSVADAMKVAATVASGSYYQENGVNKQVYVKGYITSIDALNTQYNNTNAYIADTANGTTTFELFRLTPDGTYFKADGDVAVGDLVVATGYIQNYNGKYELSPNGSVKVTLVSLTKGSGETPDPNPPTPVETEHAGTQADPYTIADAIKATANLADGEYLQENGANKQVFIKGYITKIDAINTTYNNTNAYIADTANGTTTFYVYRLAPDATFFKADGDLTVGDQVTLCGYLKNYKGTMQLCNNGTTNVYVVDMTAAVDTRTDAEKVADSLKAATMATTKFTKTGEFALPASSERDVTFAYASSNTTLLTVNGNKFTVVALPETQDTVTVTLTATCGTATDTKEFVLTLEKPTVNPNEQTVSLSFTDKTKRISLDSNSQVWQDNGIKLTNEKGNSTTAVADYAPVRLYKSSNVKIELANMTQIVFNCATYTGKDYAADLVSSVGTMEGVTAVKDGTKVTVTFATARNEFSFVCANQIRLNSIDVTAAASAAAVAKSASKYSANGAMLQALSVATASNAIEVSIDFSKQGYSNGQDVSNAKIDNYITVTFSSGAKYYNTGTAVRVYGGKTMTVAALDGYKLNTVTLTFGTGDTTSKKIIVNDDSSKTYSSGALTVDAQTVTFKVDGTSGHRRIKSISVTYEPTLSAEEMALNTELDAIKTSPFETIYEQNTEVTLPASTNSNVTFAWASDNTAVTFANNTATITLQDTAIEKVTVTLTASLNGKAKTTTFEFSLGAKFSENEIAVREQLENVSDTLFASNYNEEGMVELPASKNENVKFVWEGSDASVVEFESDYSIAYIYQAFAEKQVSVTLTASCGTGDTVFSTTKTFAFTISAKQLAANQARLDFVTGFSTYASEWNNSYSKREVSFADVGVTKYEGKVILERANKQSAGATIVDRPVFAGNKTSAAQYITLSITSGQLVSSVEFDLLKWGSKTFNDIHIEYTLDGTTWTTCSKTITTPEIIESNKKLPLGVNQVRLSITAGSTSNTQLGLTAIYITTNNEQNLGEYTMEDGTNKTAYGSVEFLGASVRIANEENGTKTGVRFGYVLSVYDENGLASAELASAVAQNILGNFSVSVAGGAAQEFAIKTYKLDGNKIIMNAVITNDLHAETNEADKESCNKDISIVINVKLSETLTLSASGTRKIVDVATKAYGNGEITLELAQRYGYVEVA